MIQPLPRRFSTQEFERMARAGVWPEDARLELLDGEVFDMAPIGPEHVYRVLSLQEVLFREVGTRTVLLSQSPIFLSEYAEPQPDLALLQAPKSRYRTRLARAEDVLLVVEVADSSLEYDRSKKLPIYARAGIPEVWILNVNEEQLEVYRQPQGERYASLATHAPGTKVAPIAFSDAPIAWWT